MASFNGADAAAGGAKAPQAKQRSATVPPPCTRAGGSTASARPAGSSNVEKAPRKNRAGTQRFQGEVSNAFAAMLPRSKEVPASKATRLEDVLAALRAANQEAFLLAVKDAVGNLYCLFVT